MNNSTLTRFFVMIPDPKGSANLYAAYTDNEFIMKQFMCSVESGMIFGITGVSRYNVFEYMALSDTHLFDLIHKDFNVEMTVNNWLELYTSSICEDVCLYLSELMWETLDVSYVYDTYNISLYNNLKYISNFKSMLKLPSESSDMISILNDIYMPLIIILNTIDIFSIDNSNMKKVLIHLLSSKGIPNKEIQLFNIYNILDEVLLMYNIFRGGSCDDEGGE